MEKLKIIYLQETQLKCLQGNPRNEIDDAGVEKLKKLIKQHTFGNPLTVYKEGKDYTILCGNHRFEAGVQLGMAEFPCIEYKGTKKKALARAISDNKSNEWTGFDFPLLKDMIIEIDTGSFNLPEITGFDQEELNDMFGIVGSEEKEQGKEKSTKECPKCGCIF